MQGLMGALVLLSIVLAVVGIFLLFRQRSRPAARSILISAAVLFGVAFVIAFATSDSQVARIDKNLEAVPDEQIKQQAQTYSFESLARSPDAYKGKLVNLRGKVIQVLENGSDVTLRVSVTEGKYGLWTDPILVNYRKHSPSEERVLENDIVSVWGEYSGIISYKAVLGQTIQIPNVVARIVERGK